MSRITALGIALTLAGAASVALAADPPASWDGLSHIASKKIDAVYLLPGADFRAYTKVRLDPTEVAFQKNWVRNYNSQEMDISTHISAKDAQDILTKARSGFEDIFRKAYTDGGYQVVDASGPDVLQVRTAVLNLSISAPDRRMSGRDFNLAPQAGEATVVIEARDSESGALLGRAVDERVAGESMPYLRNAASNRADFAQLFRLWAKASVSGLNELKAMSPVNAPQAPSR